MSYCSVCGGCMSNGAKSGYSKNHDLYSAYQVASLKEDHEGYRLKAKERIADLEDELRVTKLQRDTILKSVIEWDDAKISLNNTQGNLIDAALALRAHLEGK